MSARERPISEILVGTRHRKAFGDIAGLETTATKPAGFPKVKGLQDYNNKIIEFAHANTNAAFDFVQKLSGVKSPSAFLELSTNHARKQFETLTEQTKQLAKLAQKATLATAEPLKTGVAEAFNT